MVRCGIGCTQCGPHCTTAPYALEPVSPLVQPRCDHRCGAAAMTALRLRAALSDCARWLRQCRAAGPAVHVRLGIRQPRQDAVSQHKLELGDRRLRTPAEPRATALRAADARARRRHAEPQRSAGAAQGVRGVSGLRRQSCALRRYDCDGFRLQHTMRRVPPAVPLVLVGLERCAAAAGAAPVAHQVVPK